MYGAVMLAVIVMQAALSAIACHYIAESRDGARTRRWTLLGCLIGPPAILLTWNFAGWRQGQGGLQRISKA
jgi:hypothetical protein